MSVPALRITPANDAPIRADGDFVLYWMTAFRRTRWNFALERAVEHARALRKPLVVLEALRTGYEHASDRLHHFVIEGMADNARRFAGKRVTYHPYIEPEAGAGSGLLEDLAAQACVVVADDYPCFFLPRMLAAAAPRLGVRVEKVDSNGLLPLRATDRVFARAFDFRRFLHKHLAPHLDDFPAADPLARLRIPTLDALPAALRKRWPAAAPVEWAANPGRLDALPLDHRVGITETCGGSTAAEGALDRFRRSRLARYLDDRNQPDGDATSELSPYLHFGHISSHQVFAALMEDEEWTPDALGPPTGAREGWWGCSPPVEAFLDQLVTWREVGFNLCWQREDYATYDSLPDWALRTLAEHAGDPRPSLYSHEEFEAATTHDPLWNAAQTQLVREGRIHNYLRMLWGKKILHWAESPRAALRTMIELNDRYALDGRDPNSYSGIFWVLGRYDRAWGPEREVFGKIRYMTSESAARKLRLKDYLARYSSTD